MARGRLVGGEFGKAGGDGFGVEVEPVEAGVDFLVGNGDGAGEGRLVRERVKESEIGIGFFAGADGAGGDAGVIVEGFFAGLFFDVAPVGIEPVQGGGFSGVVADEIGEEIDMVLGADNARVFEEGEQFLGGGGSFGAGEGGEEV